MVDGHTVHYRDEGRNNKKTVVLLHGFLQNLDVWSSYVLTYMHDFRVVTIDLPGHGHTDTFGEVHSMDMMARVVKTVLDEAGISQCVMIGHSMGGYVALAFAEKFPYSLRGLGLVNSHALADSESHRESRQAVCEQVKENRASYIVNFVPTLFDDSKRAALMQDIKDLQDQCLETRAEGIIAAQLGMMNRPSRISVLQHLEVPVLFIHGKNDSRIPLEIAISQAMIPHPSEILLFDNVGHMSFLEEREYIKPPNKNFVDTCYY